MNSNDKKHPTPMIDQISEQKRESGIEDKTTGIADVGYFSENAIMNNKDNEDFSIVVSPSAEERPVAIGKNEKGKAVPLDGYNVNDFTYYAARDIYICSGKKRAQTHNKKSCNRS